MPEMSEMRKPVASERTPRPIFGPGAHLFSTATRRHDSSEFHPRTLQRMVLRGEITGVRVGKLWRFAPSAIRD